MALTFAVSRLMTSLMGSCCIPYKPPNSNTNQKKMRNLETKKKTGKRKRKSPEEHEIIFSVSDYVHLRSYSVPWSIYPNLGDTYFITSIKSRRVQARTFWYLLIYQFAWNSFPIMLLNACPRFFADHRWFCSWSQSWYFLRPQVAHTNFGRFSEEGARVLRWWDHGKAFLRGDS